MRLAIYTDLLTSSSPKNYSGTFQDFSGPGWKRYFFYYFPDCMKPVNILTRITYWGISCVYIHIYQTIKNWGSGPYNSLRHADDRKYISGLSLTQKWREAHMIYLLRDVGKIWRCSFWDKGSFIMINKFKMVKAEKFEHLHLVYYLTVSFSIFKKDSPTDVSLVSFVEIG